MRKAQAGSLLTLRVLWLQAWHANAMDSTGTHALGFLSLVLYWVGLFGLVWLGMVAILVQFNC